ncbi:MAG TPA: efflux RND transporter periplasmic adaptor subunit [Xanthobacteraceae bacterium]|nr:efflux RND transporter periplasmic adaptor subunit [Xanthobacteraceae bacterium]
MRVSFALSLLLIGFVAVSTPAANAHEGHDHNTSAPVSQSLTPRGEAESDAFQLVAVLRDRALTLYLDRFATNEAMSGATVEVETPSGPQAAEAVGEGIYLIAAPWAKGADHYDLIFTVTAGDKVDVLTLTILDTPREANAAPARSLWWVILAALIAATVFLSGVMFARHFPRALRIGGASVLAFMLAAFATDSARAHEGHDDNKRMQTSRDASQRLPDGTIFVPKPVQRLLTIRTLVVKEGRHAKSLELPGRIIPDPNASGYVQSTLAGRLLPPPAGFPVLGSRVEKGQVLAYVSPPVQTIDISDMRQKEGELLQQISILERRVARYEKLAETNTISRTQLDEARLELQGLRDRKIALDKTRAEPEALIAPVSGVIAETNTIAGQLAQPNTVVFQIVDPSRLWVEALSFEALPDLKAASARNHNGHSVSLEFRGSGAALRNQAIPIHFAIDGETNGVWAGQFVSVFVKLPDERKGIALPRTAVVRAANGLHVVFEQVSAERFQPREVKIEALDAENVLVTAGIENGKRIVVQGTELIEQVR